MQEQVDRIERKVDQISDALLGTEYTQNKGMIDAVQQNTKFRRKMGIYAAFFTTIGTFIGGLLAWLKAKLFGI